MDKNKITLPVCDESLLNAKPVAFVRKRSGGQEPFSVTKIIRVITAALHDTQESDSGVACQVAEGVVRELQTRASNSDAYIPHIEEIQDIVEVELMRAELPVTAKSYILYRAERESMRKAEQEVSSDESGVIHVTMRDGSREPFDADRINKSIERACAGLTDPIAKVTQIATETQLTLYDGINEDEIDIATINAALQNTVEDVEYDRVATRIYIKTLYKRILGGYKTYDEVLALHQQKFEQHIRECVDAGLLDSRMIELFDFAKLAQALDPSRDELLKYSGISTMAHRYMLKGSDQKPIEVPQFFWMRVGMGLSLVETGDATDQAIAFYDKVSRLEYLAAGSVNLGVGTPNPKLSNCFLLEMHDSMEHIGKTVSDVLQLSKASGGIGLSITKLRAEGSVLKSSNTVSSGPIPFVHIIDSAIRAVIRGGKKKGALCFYMENWHLDFDDFLELKQNAGDDYRRARTANTAVYISDEFMRRVAAGEDWYLFDPNEVTDLNELYGEQFSKRYGEYCDMAERGHLRLWQKMPAAQQFKSILVNLQATSHPWLTWKDTINNRALNNNTGIIHNSNLCTEICLPNDLHNIAVCNIASINLARHVVDGKMDWDRLADSSRSILRLLDNLVDTNVQPLPETARADSENRAVGVGAMGLADVFELYGFAYDDPRAHDLTDKIFEFISYHTISASCDLAAERGSYKNFAGSRWSQGMVPFDTLTEIDKRGTPLTVSKQTCDEYGPKLDWDALRARVKQGVRNATVMAIAPNANIGLLAGVSPGIDPRFAQLFSRNKFSGKYVEINHNMVHDIARLGIWEQVSGEIVKSQGSIAEISALPPELRAVYKTSFEISPYAFIEVAARAQKWVDQALSRNMYLDTRDINEIMRIYQTAWEKGLKTTYYLHMKPQHTAEQSTTRVNKAESLVGKRGFAALRSSAVSVPVSSVDTSAASEPKLESLQSTSSDVVATKKYNIIIPDDPANANICEGCQ